MTAEKIIDLIKKDSEKKVKQIITETQKQVKDILNTAKKEAEIEVEKILNQGKKNSENNKKIIIARANHEAKREKMSAKEKIIEECFLKAHHKLSIIKDNEYEIIVRKLIENGYKKLGKDCKVLVSREIDKKIARELGITIVGTVETTGGIILKSLDDRITLDHTFDGILKMKKDKIRIKVGKLLFSD